MTFAVLLDNFQGPLDLLLQLTEREQLDIKDVSISTITASYLEHLRHLEIDPHDINSFLSIATQLVFYKSQRALPGQDSSEDISELEDQSPADLAAQLERYKFFRELAKRIGTLSAAPFIGRQDSFSLDVAKDKRQIDTSPKQLHELWLGMVDQSSKLSATIPVHSVKLKPLSIEEVMAGLLSRLQGEAYTDLDHILGFSKDKQEAVLIFLSILELSKTGLVDCKLDGERLLVCSKQPQELTI